MFKYCLHVAYNISFISNHVHNNKLLCEKNVKNGAIHLQPVGKKNNLDLKLSLNVYFLTFCDLLSYRMSIKRSFSWKFCSGI